jgi:hypothetical protein
VGSSTISPYFTIPRLQLRIASTTHYTISWTSCQRTWTSHHTNLTLAEPHIKLLYANLTLPRPRKVQKLDIYTNFTLPQPHTTSHWCCANLSPRIAQTSHFINPAFNMWTAQGPNLTLHLRHIAWVPQDVNFILYVESHYINFNFTIASTSCTPTPHCFTIHGVLQIGAGRRIGAASPTTKFDSLLEFVRNTVFCWVRVNDRERKN